MSIRSVLLSTVLATGCLTAPTGTSINVPTGPGKRILFIGNSLTYVNDLPGMVAAIADQAGDTVQVRSVAFPDYALEDHWNEGTSLRALRATTWDVVVMQQGPSSLPENQVFLKTWTVRFNPEIRAAGAVPALYMVWPSLARQGDFPGVKAAYKGAATEVNGLFLPAGAAWLRAIARDPSLQLYGADGFHPSPLGSLLAALVIYERLYGKSVVGLAVPPAFGALNTSIWQMLTEAAHETVEAEK